MVQGQKFGNKKIKLLLSQTGKKLILVSVILLLSHSGKKINTAISYIAAMSLWEKINTSTRKEKFVRFFFSFHAIYIILQHY